MIKIKQNKEKYLKDHVKGWTEWSEGFLDEDLIRKCTGQNWDDMVQPLIDSGRAEIVQND